MGSGNVLKSYLPVHVAPSMCSHSGHKNGHADEVSDFC